MVKSMEVEPADLAGPKHFRVPGLFQPCFLRLSEEEAPFWTLPQAKQGPFH